MRYVLGCLLAIAVSALAGASSAKAASIEGDWSGDGIATLTSGEMERVRCRVRYSKGSGRTFGLSATCAYPTGTIEQSGRVVQLKGGNRYSGRLYNPEYAVSGSMSVTVKGRQQTVILKSAKGSAELILTKR